MERINCKERKKERKNEKTKKGKQQQTTYKRRKIENMIASSVQFRTRKKFL